MGLVLLDMAMSLDGFAADRTGGVDTLYPDLGELRASDVMQELIGTTGAVVMGRRAYDMGEPDGYEDYEYQVPIFVLTHRVPERPAGGLVHVRDRRCGERRRNGERCSRWEERDRDRWREHGPAVLARGTARRDPDSPRARAARRRHPPLRL